MSTNRSNDRSSLCSFTFVDGRHRPVSSRAQRRIRFRRRSGGLQTGQRDGRERPWCPVAPAFRGGPLFANPEHSQESAFRRCISAKPSSKSCPSPSTNTSTPTAQIPGAKPFAPLTNSPPITCRPTANRRLLTRLQPLFPRPHPTRALRSGGLQAGGGFPTSR